MRMNVIRKSDVSNLIGDTDLACSYCRVDERVMRWLRHMERMGEGRLLMSVMNAS